MSTSIRSWCEYRIVICLGDEERFLASERGVLSFLQISSTGQPQNVMCRGIYWSCPNLVMKQIVDDAIRANNVVRARNGYYLLQNSTTVDSDEDAGNVVDAENAVFAGYVDEFLNADDAQNEHIEEAGNAVNAHNENKEDAGNKADFQNENIEEVQIAQDAQNENIEEAANVAHAQNENIEEAGNEANVQNENLEEAANAEAAQHLEDVQNIEHASLVSFIERMRADDETGSLGLRMLLLAGPPDFWDNFNPFG